MARLALPLAVIAAALAGCGGSDAHSGPASRKPAGSDLQLLQAGDIAGVTFGQGSPFAVRTPREQAKLDHVPDEVPALERDGFQSGRAVRLALRGGGGYSTATRFRDAAAARRQLRAAIVPATAGYTRAMAPAPGLPSGRFVDFRGAGNVCRNVYAVRGPTLYFTGFCTRTSGDPGRAALLAGAKKVLARVPR